jgi:mono/diheme cytochrome c family protein
MTTLAVLVCLVLLTSCSQEGSQPPPTQPESQEQAAAETQPDEQTTQPAEPQPSEPGMETNDTQPSTEMAPEETTEPMTTATGDATAGKTLYGKKCVTCHGVQGEGKEAIAKMLKVELKHLGSPEVQSRSDAELTKAIAEGTGKMKPVKNLNEADLANLVAFMRTLK